MTGHLNSAWQNKWLAGERERERKKNLSREKKNGWAYSENNEIQKHTNRYNKVHPVLKEHKNCIFKKS